MQSCSADRRIGFSRCAEKPSCCNASASPRLSHGRQQDQARCLELRIGLDPAAQVFAVHAGHHHVDQRDLERVAAAGGFAAVAQRGSPLSASAKRQPQDASSVVTSRRFAG